MILSASRRTDIPAFYSEWFINRLKDGFVYVQNPMNANQISNIKLSPEVVDCIVFWTKNPKPLIEKLNLIDNMGYKYYFQFTLNPYDKTIEKGLDNKKEIITTFISLSKMIGKEKIIWRYDPIIINDQLSMEYHINAFKNLSKQLSEYTNEVIISFIDPYRKTKNNMKDCFFREVNENEMTYIAENFSKIANNYNITLKTCAEKIELSQYGIEHASCIDKKKIENIIGCSLKSNIKKDGQRESCGCIECIDIGAYNTCKNGCKYCYATFNENIVLINSKKHNAFSPLLVEDNLENKKISNRVVNSYKFLQKTFFE